MAASPSALAIPPLDFGLRLKLSLMMFLQFAVWGSWFTVLGPYMKHLNFNDVQVGGLYALMPLGAILSTLFVGQISDRLMASEKLMALFHLVGAGLLYWMAQIQDPGSYGVLWGVSLTYALLYNPTLALSNTIAFTHVPSGERDFPSIRVFGTIGWIAAGLLVGKVLSTETTPAEQTNQPMLLGAAFSAVLGVLSLLLPHTPPTGKAGDGIPFLKALGLFKDPSFAVFFLVSFAITIVLAFYYSFTGVFLSETGVKDVASTMSIGQFAELLLLPFLPFFLKAFRMRTVLALGMLCWGLRYALFAWGSGTSPAPATAEGVWGSAQLLQTLQSPFMLVVIGVALHGICFDFFFAAGFIHVDNTAPADIRGSGQALFSFLTYGLGMWLGSLLSGVVKTAYTKQGIDVDVVTGVTTEVSVTDWTGFWLVPAVGVTLALLVFLALFRPKAKPQSSEMGAPA